MGVRPADHRDQALVETYVVLLGVRFWAKLWCEKPSVVRVRSDSMAAFGSLFRGRSTRSPAINKVLKELALTVALSPTGLRLRFKHLAGDRNQWTDALSRLSQPCSGARVPAPLLGCPRTAVEDRGSGWWLTEGVPEEVVVDVPGAEEAV